MKNEFSIRSILTIIAYILYIHIYLKIKYFHTINTKHKIRWLEQNKIIHSDQTLRLSGIFSGKENINVYIDDELIDVFQNHKKFEAVVDLGLMDCGWHKITATINDEETSLYIHKISNKEGVIVNEYTVELATEQKQKIIPNYYKYIVDKYNPRYRYFYNSIDDDTTYQTAIKDENGIILLPKPFSIWQKYYYNPVTIAQTALKLYGSGSFTNDNENKRYFLKYADWFVEKSVGGAYKYDILWFCGPTLLFPKWVSGMAQGQALSVLSRAYTLTKDKKYLDAGFKALTFLSQPVDTGGCTCCLNHFASLSSSLSHMMKSKIVEEYPTDNPPLVLNGNLFALIGLYDWSIISTEEYGRTLATSLFKEGCQSIAALLPYYDYYTYSSYSLSQWICDIPPCFDSPYAHDCHIFLLHTLYEITGIKIFEEYYKRFLSYIS